MSKTVILLLDNLRSVENTASIFRTGEALGVKKIYCLGTTPTPLDRFGRKRADFAKVSLGAEEMVEWEYAREAFGVIKDLRDQEFQIISLEQHSNSQKLSKIESNKLVLVVGNEVEGVSKEILSISDSILEIPMLGHKESLNVSVATGIALWELIK